MKNSTKQILVATICILIIFIPTYIAITYFIIQSSAPDGGRYTVEITDQSGKSIALDSTETGDVAEAVLKMNSKLSGIDGIDPASLPARYYDIKLTDTENGEVTAYRYYFSVNENERTVVRGETGNYYTLALKDTRAFMSRSCAYVFYDSSALPALSIFGGDDVTPTKAEWRYKVINGTMIESPLAENTVGNGAEYAMSGSTRLSFSIAPDTLTVKVYQNGTEILRSDTLDAIPYDLLDSTSLSFKISASWTSHGSYRGEAEYDFKSFIAKAPEFMISDSSIESGEFFTVTGLNISAPQKVEFESIPSIGVTPVFFAEGDNAYALIPIDKDLPSPMVYIFKFTYGESVTEIEVSVSERTVLEREYTTGNIKVERNDRTIGQYNELLREIGSKHESVRYFDGTFLDFTTHYPSEVAAIRLGYGHKRIPTGTEGYRLDGVDYMMLSGVDIPAIAAGKVIYSGYCDLLGNFAVIDHGFGLKTWYCHLSENFAAVGTVVAKGAIIGKAGVSGYTNSSGVYLITTVLNVPVSPYPLQESGINITQ